MPNAYCLLPMPIVHRLDSDRREASLLSLPHLRDVEALQRLVEEAVEIELGPEMDENPAETNGGAIHEDEFARHPDRSLLLQGAVHLEGLAAAIMGGRDAVGDGANPVLEQRPIDEAGPNVENVDQLVVEPLETPDLVGTDHAIA